MKEAGSPFSVKGIKHISSLELKNERRHDMMVRTGSYVKRKSRKSSILNSLDGVLSPGVEASLNDSMSSFTSPTLPTPKKGTPMKCKSATAIMDKKKFMIPDMNDDDDDNRSTTSAGGAKKSSRTPKRKGSKLVIPDIFIAKDDDDDDNRSTTSAASNVSKGSARIPRRGSKLVIPDVFDDDDNRSTTSAASNVSKGVVKTPRRGSKVAIPDVFNDDDNRSTTSAGGSKRSSRTPKRIPSKLVIPDVFDDDDNRSTSSAKAGASKRSSKTPKKSSSKLVNPDLLNDDDKHLTNSVGGSKKSSKTPKRIPSKLVIPDVFDDDDNRSVGSLKSVSRRASRTPKRNPSKVVNPDVFTEEEKRLTKSAQSNVSKKSSETPKKSSSKLLIPDISDDDYKRLTKSAPSKKSSRTLQKASQKLMIPDISDGDEDDKRLTKSAQSTAPKKSSKTLQKASSKLPIPDIDDDEEDDNRSTNSVGSNLSKGSKKTSRSPRKGSKRVSKKTLEKIAKPKASDDKTDPNANEILDKKLIIPDLKGAGVDDDDNLSMGSVGSAGSARSAKSSRSRRKGSKRVSKKVLQEKLVDENMLDRSKSPVRSPENEDSKKSSTKAQKKKVLVPGTGDSAKMVDLTASMSTVETAASSETLQSNQASPKTIVTQVTRKSPLRQRASKVQQKRTLVPSVGDGEKMVDLTASMSTVETATSSDTLQSNQACPKTIVTNATTKSPPRQRGSKVQQKRVLVPSMGDGDKMIDLNASMSTIETNASSDTLRSAQSNQPCPKTIVTKTKTKSPTRQRNSTKQKELEIPAKPLEDAGKKSPKRSRPAMEFLMKKVNSVKHMGAAAKSSLDDDIVLTQSIPETETTPVVEPAVARLVEDTAAILPSKSSKKKKAETTGSFLNLPLKSPRPAKKLGAAETFLLKKANSQRTMLKPRTSTLKPARDGLSGDESFSSIQSDLAAKSPTRKARVSVSKQAKDATVAQADTPASPQRTKVAVTSSANEKAKMSPSKQPKDSSVTDAPSSPPPSDGAALSLTNKKVPASAPKRAEDSTVVDVDVSSSPSPPDVATAVPAEEKADNPAPAGPSDSDGTMPLADEPGSRPKLERTPSKVQLLKKKFDAASENLLVKTVRSPKSVLKTRISAPKLSDEGASVKDYDSLSPLPSEVAPKLPAAEIEESSTHSAGNSKPANRKPLAKKKKGVSPMMRKRLSIEALKSRFESQRDKACPPAFKASTVSRGTVKKAPSVVVEVESPARNTESESAVHESSLSPLVVEKAPLLAKESAPELVETSSVARETPSDCPDTPITEISAVVGSGDNSVSELPVTSQAAEPVTSEAPAPVECNEDKSPKQDTPPEPESSPAVESPTVENSKSTADSPTRKKRAHSPPPRPWTPPVVDDEDDDEGSIDPFDCEPVIPADDKNTSKSQTHDASEATMGSSNHSYTLPLNSDSAHLSPTKGEEKLQEESGRMNRSIRFSGVVNAKSIPRITPDEFDLLYYSTENFSEFRHEAFLEKAGLNPSDWE